MSMRDITIDEIASIAAPQEAEQALHMTEEAFRGFYDQTSRPLWTYLARTTGDPRLADDLLQEAYYRFLRARVSFESDDHRRFYLFRVATNLVRDERRRPREQRETRDTPPDSRSADVSERAATRIDVARALERLTPRDRSLLWLAYAQGCSHDEIARTVGVKAASLKALLHRARRRLASVLRSSEGASSGRGGRR